MNRLSHATSPYLQQHKDNPVDWWPWSDQAFAEARKRDVPVLLSVGYAACHWCHVMAHESFEDDDVAAYLNPHFVAVKVDREERPDIDAVYMEATQAMTGQGGWPMTCFLTPDGAPFFCGTYFPKPHFLELMRRVTSAWETQREALVAQAEQVVRALSETAPRPSAGAVSEDDFGTALSGLIASYDSKRGGFGGAPKFPPSMVLEFLLRHHARTGDRAALHMVKHTCEAMARGGMYDQIGGGFARYSVDADWVVPHFEKMLYDNALLLRVYTHLWRTTGEDLPRRIAIETAEWMLRDLRTTEGGFASSLDADSEGEEGKFYVWKPDEVGPEAAAMFNVTDSGTFEHGRSVLQLLADPDDTDAYTAERARLLAIRAQRVPPTRDDKVVAAWNGLAIAGLAEAGLLFERADLVDAARAAADLVLRVHMGGNALRRTSRDGKSGDSLGVLEDHGDLAEGLLALYAVTGEIRWYDAAAQLLDVVLDRFADGDGGFYDTRDDAERLVRRPRDPTDNATPSGASASAGALLTYAALSGSQRHRNAAVTAVGGLAEVIRRFPRHAGWSAAVAEAVLAGPVEVAIVGDTTDPATLDLLRTAVRATSPGAAVAIGSPGGVGVPLLADRGLVDGRPAAYVCRNFACERPVTDPAELARSLAEKPLSHSM
ncbi:MAG: thioredoxin domain-containing protein [Actinomycetes bacterium]